jgi:hypothetical protein
MFTITPPPRTSCCPKIWQQKNTPVSITSIERRQSSSENSSDGPINARPALFTSTSQRPRSRSTAAATAATSSRTETSHR